MRSILLVPCVLSIPACADVCGTPDQMNGTTYDAFMSPLTYEITNETAFPSYSSPANGPVTLGFTWPSADPEGGLEVAMDGQAFEANGLWSTRECGNFQVTWAGVYQAEDSGHAFVGAADFVIWPGGLEGFVEWSENWTDRVANEVGTYDAFALLRGDAP